MLMTNMCASARFNIDIQDSQLYHINEQTVKWNKARQFFMQISILSEYDINASFTLFENGIVASKLNYCSCLG